MILYEDYRKISGALSVQTLGNCRIYKSYSTIVAIKTETDFFVTDRKYSVTTSRHMSIIHRQEKYISSTEKTPDELNRMEYTIRIDFDNQLGKRFLETEDFGGYSAQQLITHTCERLLNRKCLSIRKIAKQESYGDTKISRIFFNTWENGITHINVHNKEIFKGTRFLGYFGS